MMVKFINNDNKIQIIMKELKVINNYDITKTTHVTIFLP